MGGFTLRQLGQVPTSFENVYASTYTCLNIVDLHGRGVAMLGEELACSVDGELQVRDVPHREHAAPGVARPHRVCSISVMSCTNAFQLIWTSLLRAFGKSAHSSDHDGSGRHVLASPDALYHTVTPHSSAASHWHTACDVAFGFMADRRPQPHCWRGGE